MPSLFVIQGRDQGRRFELEGPRVGVGRDISNTIQIHDTEVSRVHAELSFQDDACTLTDLGSSNGSHVNGKRVEQCILQSGDQLQLGRTLMLFTAGGDGSSHADLVEQVDIVSRPSGEDSRIVRSMTQQESSDLFNFGTAGVQSPWLARARSNLQIMYRTALAVSHTLDIDELLNRIMQLIFEWVEADRGCMMLMNQEIRELEPKARRNRKGVARDDKIRISKTILDYVLEHTEGVLTSNAREDDRWNPAGSIVQMGIREAICVPMQGRYGMVGVIYIDTYTSPQQALQRGGGNKFTDDHLKLMIAIAHQAALAVEDTSYYSAMVQAERLAAVGHTIATLSHHIKNILQGIRGGSYLIELGLADHDEEIVSKGWNIVEKNQGRISNLVMDMLTFSKEREPDLQPGNINATVGEVIELMRARAEELDVRLDWNPAGKMPTAMFDHEGIHRAVTNVVTNAIDACDGTEEGSVVVATEHDAAQKLLRVIVTDNGTGIEPDDIEKMFTVFVSHKGSRGTGLGLSVSQKIFEEHGGRILVTSEPGQGSNFTLEMPAVEPPSPASGTPAGKQGQTGTFNAATKADGS